MGLTDEISNALTGGKGFNFGGITQTLTILVVVLVLTVSFAVISYLILTSRRYNKKITIFENLAGKGYVPTGTDKAMVVKVGDGGEEILFLKKRKLYRTAYGKKIGKNHYAFVIGSDGYWYNSEFGDFDSEMEKLGWKPTDRDLRYMHVAIRRNIKDRYEKTTFLQKYGGLIAYISLIAITGIMMWLLFDKFLDITSASNQAVESAKQVLESTQQILSANDNILSGGSGIR